MVQSINVSGIANALKVIWNPSLAMPHLIVNDIRAIPFSELKQRGIRAFAFDKDNCLTAPYVSHIHPPFKEAWGECVRTMGADRVVIVSNSAGTSDDKDHKDRYPSSALYLSYPPLLLQAEKLESALGVPVLRHAAKKPSGGAFLAKHLHPIPPNQVAVVGDRILTDVLFGNLNGNYTIWTRQIVSEEGDNKAALFLRRMEHRLVAFLQRRNVSPPSHAMDADDN